jgi:hypothetical protein
VSIFSEEQIRRITKDNLKDLVPFQLRSAKNAFQSLQHYPHRFLIADEVGLGKTFVSKGVIALRIQQMVEVGENAINIVYVCSNQSIASQNIDTLDFFAKEKDIYDKKSKNHSSTRLTLLATNPLLEANEKNTEVFINFISFTSGTSFDLRSSTGKKKERIILYDLLNDNCKKEHSAFLKDILQCGVGRNSWSQEIANVNRSKVIESVNEKFQSVIIECQEIWNNVKNIWSEMKDTEEFHFYVRRQKKSEEDSVYVERQRGDIFEAKSETLDEFISSKDQFIGLLREKLAHICLELLRPSLIIMDEFQNFKKMLYSTKENNISEKMEEREARVFKLMEGLVKGQNKKPPPLLLISATPYSFNPSDIDLSQEPSEDFLQLIQFLSQSEITNLKQDFKNYRKELVQVFLNSESDTQLLKKKKNIEYFLHKVMSRTERVRQSSEGNSMKRIENITLQLQQQDLVHYEKTVRLFQKMGVGNPLDFCKSASYLPYFMQNYAYNRNFMSKFFLSKSLQHPKVMTSETQDVCNQLLEYQKVSLIEKMKSYQEVEPYNAAIRHVIQEMVTDGHQLLWIPSTLEYWQISNEDKDICQIGLVFSRLRKDKYTKRLVFSGWNVVPDTISALVSYDAERQMLPEIPEYRRLGKHFLPKGMRLTTTLEQKTQFALLYPSQYLASLDVISKNEKQTLQEIRASLQVQIQKRMDEQLQDDKVEQTGRENSWWYVLGPMLLDSKEERETFRRNHWQGKKIKALGDYNDRQDDEEEDNLNEKPSEERISTLQRYLDKINVFLDNPEMLGKKPADLIDVMVDLSLGSPSVLALRMLKNTMVESKLSSAYDIAKSFRALFNKPAHIALLYKLFPQENQYWKKVISYCIAGNLQALLDEMYYSLNGDLKKLSRQIRPNHTSVQIKEWNVEKRSEGSILTSSESLPIRASFAQRFANMTDESKGKITTIDNIRESFNSPFHPFILSSTSVGQEGLNFHLWCHSVIHWNLPNSPTALEQREGRVHRYKGHAIRRNIAKKWKADAFQEYTGKMPIWKHLERIANEKIKKENPNNLGLYPFWLMEQKKIEDTVVIRVIKMHYPFSKEKRLFFRLNKQLAGYRLAFGQPNQKELLDYIELTGLSNSEIRKKTEKYAINLNPTCSEVSESGDAN